MTPYHKIQTIYKREKFKNNRLIEGDWSLPEFQYLSENMWVFDEKIDGTNIRIMFDKEENKVSFGGRTDNAQIPVTLYEKLQELFPLEKFQNFESSICLYGEGFGKKIQKAGSLYNPNGVDFILFDVKAGRWWLQREDIEKIASDLGIQIVPQIGFGTLFDAISMVQDDFKSTFGDFQAEGIVARPMVPLAARNGSRIITKIKCCDFKS